MASVTEPQRQRILKYALALAATGAALLVAFAIRPYVGPTIIPPFLLAVAVAALYGGRGPGAAATVLSAAALDHWFFPPFGAQTPASLAPQLMFLLIAAVITWIGGSVQDQRRHALVQAAENARLRQQAEHAHHLAEEESSRARDSAMESEIAALEAAEALARQQEAEKALRSSEAQLADFFDTASTGLHWVAQDGTITRANRAELDMLGYAHDEYVGHHIAEFHADQPVIEDILRRLLAGETIRQYPARLRCKDGGDQVRRDRLQRIFRGWTVRPYPVLHARRHRRARGPGCGEPPGGDRHVLE